tara:strand:+ start:113 stop:334 length:222 start_codon:yes stop_codon:yes gene_type:complete
MDATAEDYKSVIFSGCAIEYKDISICNLRNYLSRNGIDRDLGYQVWSDKHNCYTIYKNIDEAVDQFIALKGNR